MAFARRSSLIAAICGLMRTEPTMNLVAYNLRSGGTRRVHWARVLEAFRPDIFLAQETVNPQDHLPPLSHPEMAERYAWRRAEGRRWGSAVYSARGELRPLDLSDFHGHVVGVEVTGSVWPDEGRAPLRAF